MIYTVFTEKHIDEAAALEAFAPDPWTQAQLYDELMCGAARMFSALDENGALCGFCALQCAAGEATLNAVTVAPNYRRQGVAKALLQYAFSQINACEVFLEVRAQNLNAIKLYEKLGFEKKGVRRAFYKNPPDDAIVMRLELLC